MSDKSWDHEIRVPVVYHLFVRRETEIGEAVRRTEHLGCRRNADGRLEVWVWVRSDSDLRLLAGATRSHTGNDMPGPLDYAFEDALPSSEWPLFVFVLSGHVSKAA